MSTKQIIIAACLAVVFGTCHSTAMPGVEAVRLYLNFDDTTAALLPVAGLRREQYLGAREQAAFGPGKVGRAYLADPAKADHLSVTHGLRDFAMDRGSMVIWCRPNWPETDRASHWLLEGAWAKFALQFSNAELLVYVTGNSQHFVRAPLANALGTWAAAWHLIVVSWVPTDDGRSEVQVYLDGQRAAGPQAVDPLATLPPIFDFGALPQPRGKPATAHFDGAVDEFALLAAPLTAADVAAIYEAGSRGLISALGGAVFVRLQRHAWLRGEAVPIEVEPYGDWDTIAVTAVSETTDLAIPLCQLRSPQKRWTLPANALRPDRYRLRADLQRQGATIVSDTRTRLAVRAARQPAFPVGLSGLTTADDALLAKAEHWQLSHASPGSYTSTAVHADLDRLFHYGLAMIPGLNLHFHRYLPLAADGGYYEPDSGRGSEKLREEVLQQLVLDGDTTFQPFTTSISSPFSTVARAAMRERLTTLLADSRGHPGLWAIAFDDEYVLRGGVDKSSGRRYYGDYSPAARAYFKQQTGLDPVFPPAAAAGTIFEDDHPYYRWREVIGMPGDATCAGLASVWAEMTALVHAQRPGVQTTTYSGGEYGEVDAIMDYAYPMIWQPAPEYPSGHGRLDFLYDRHRARQRQPTPKPVWGLVGWWSGDLREQPDYCVQDFRLSTAMAIAKGLKSITWFTAWSPEPVAGQPGGGILSRPDLTAEMIRWSAWLHRFGPLLARFEARPSGRVAVLFSEDNYAGKVHRQNSPDDFKWLYPCMRLAGVPVDLVTDEQVRRGILDSYQALVLLRFDYASRGLWQAVQAFANTPGKRIYTDAASGLHPDHERPLGVAAGEHVPLGDRQFDISVILDTYAMLVPRLRQAMADEVDPAQAIVSGSDFVAAHWLAGGDSRLLALVNYHLFAAQAVSIGDLPGSIYALGDHAHPTPGQTITIAAGDALFYLVCPRPIGPLTGDLQLLADGFDLQVQASDAAGSPMAAAIPLQVTVTDPAGQVVAAYEQFTATTTAAGQVHRRIPRAALMDAAGVWRLTVTELLTGGALSQPVTVP